MLTNPLNRREMQLFINILKVYLKLNVSIALFTLLYTELLLVPSGYVLAQLIPLKINGVKQFGTCALYDRVLSRYVPCETLFPKVL